MRNVLVLGGSRYFGRRAVERMLAAGDRVTVLNRGSSPPPAGATHLVADRDDEAALRTALGDRTFDTVIDQVCYTPVQADIARRVFAGRTARYVMTSTIEVYGHLDLPRPVREDDIDLSAVVVDPTLPWGRMDFLEEHYGEGKRQAEAVLSGAAGASGASAPAADPGFAFASLRVAHVLGGGDDFTGRVDYYARRLRTGSPIPVPAPNHPSTYVHVEEIADFVVWAGRQDFTGPVNANAHGPLRTEDICAALARETGGAAEFREVEVGQTSPLSFTHSYGMDNTRATRLGFTFSHTSAWLSRALAETVYRKES
ncbi:NAD-dependent epimerase/dehydratase family protein [Streptomyces boncukensis]|uniref:NAD-dependent epimerase/dehydratase family protein n=1 Tax=Streptomyces boncukensis TaxID=2711219 RepID=A0A6G4WSI4_9ACTN|nr:NAD-dependent epimerase/dehydratase family protein [Streptomyces boncukensis]NGO67441.1 NAD-dependent epimerase/dehydratase family protein [Streptomyces boncukensis]